MQTENKQLQIGAGKAPILFDKSDFPLKAFTGEHDPLHVRVFLMKWQEEEQADGLGLVSIEMTSLPPAANDRFRHLLADAAEIPFAHTYVSVTHTFSAPHIPPRVKSPEEQRLSDTLYTAVCQAIRQAAGQALDRLAPGSLSYGSSLCDINVNRNVPTPAGWWLGTNEEGYSAKDVRILSAGCGERTSVVFFSYDVQPSVMDGVKTTSGERLLTGDLAGYAMGQLEKELGNDSVAIFLPGAAGNQAPRLKASREKADGTKESIHEDGFILCREYGRHLAACVQKGLASGRQLSVGSPVIREIPADLNGQEIIFPTKELKPHTSFPFTPKEEKVPITITQIILGEAGLFLTQPELNSETGRKIREILGEKLLIATLVNGGVKYLPQEEDFERITYTAMNTGIGRGSEEILLAAITGKGE